MEPVKAIIPEGPLPGHDQDWMNISLGDLDVYVRRVAGALAIVSEGLVRVDEMRIDAEGNGAALSLKDVFSVLGNLRLLRGMEEELKRESERLRIPFGNTSRTSLCPSR
jgi:phytoene/squalene synthetase